ncbi:hypothetical protein, partial [Pseudomonas helleri]|uniref:hypothetical protein n=1 Tax=Pseudomonas helleri TaxID=1608996 RepID=UPI001E4328B6
RRMRNRTYGGVRGLREKKSLTLLDPKIQVSVRLYASHAGEVHGYTNDQSPRCEQPRRHLSGTKPVQRRK